MGCQGWIHPGDSWGGFGPKPDKINTTVYMQAGTTLYMQAETSQAKHANRHKQGMMLRLSYGYSSE